MTSDFRHRVPEFGFSVPQQSDHGTPGKRTLTGSISRRPQIVFRVESAEAARVFADAFGPRDPNGVAQGADAAVDRAAASSGSPLPADVRGQFESSVGADLSGVRIHTGDESAEASSAVGAKAYTTGQDIHFGAGEYDPSSAAGLHLLAHEVAHTVQQQGTAPVRQNKLEVSAPQDSAEIEADRAADAMVSGASAAITMGAGVQRQIFRQDAPAAAGTPAPSSYMLTSLPSNVVTLDFRPGPSMLAAVQGTKAFENAEDPTIATKISDLCSDAMWEKIPSVKTTDAAGRVGKSDCTWSIEVKPTLMWAAHKGGGAKGSASSGGNSSVQSSQQKGSGSEQGVSAGKEDKAGASAKQSSSSGTGGGSTSGGGSTTTVEAEFQTFQVCVGFQIKVTRTVKHDFDYMTPETHRNIESGTAALNVLNPIANLAKLGALATGLDPFDKVQKILKATPREEGTQTFAAFSMCIGTIEAPTKVCTKV